MQRLLDLTPTGHPSEITPALVVAYATTGQPANNTVRARVASARQFLLWCRRRGWIADSFYDDPAIRRLGSSYPSTYGKQQGHYPPRWLSRDEADRLIAQCKDGSLSGLRDELVIRFGLMGLRREEIRGLTVGSIDVQTGTLRWMGKGRKGRQHTASPGLLAALTRYLAAYPSPKMDDVLICSRPPGSQFVLNAIQWRKAMGTETVFRIVNSRAFDAGLGHLAPHDLRRSAASILHHAKTADGGHLFDLLDVQRVLGHTDPATTMKCYLEPMDTDVLDRSANYLG